MTIQTLIGTYTWAAGPFGAILGILTLPITANILSRYIVRGQTQELVAQNLYFGDNLNKPWLHKLKHTASPV